MALIECPECGREISEHAEACPHCGAPARLWEDMEIAGSDAEGREPEPTPAEDLGEDEKTTLEKVALPDTATRA